MKLLTLLQPGRIVFGDGCCGQVAEAVRARGLKRALVVTSPPIVPLVETFRQTLAGGAEVLVLSSIDAEPTIEVFQEALAQARDFHPDAVIGCGGGSALDVAKLVAALHDGTQRIEEVFGINLLAGRGTYLACLPTTAGTGSEVSPNAILADATDQLKKGVVSPHLVADEAYVDPQLTHTLPPTVTAATGMDALVHCIEAYGNKHAHPLIDVYALEGIRLIGANLKRAYEEPTDAEARAGMALGSLLGGLCLGPVNTAAVHALAYPLGGRFHIAHGVSNAVLLPAVLEFNLPAATERYAEIALALGAEPGGSVVETAAHGLEVVRALSRDVGIPQRLAELGIPVEAIGEMATAAMKVTRLLVNNPREVTRQDAERIYRAVH